MYVHEENMEKPFARFPCGTQTVNNSVYVYIFEINATTFCKNTKENTILAQNKPDFSSRFLCMQALQAQKLVNYSAPVLVLF